MTKIILQIKQRKKPTSLTMFKCDDVNNNNVNVRDQHQQTEMLSALFLFESRPDPCINKWPEEEGTKEVMCFFIESLSLRNVFLSL